MTDWTEKYRPTTLSEVRGNDSARDAFREWAETWDDHREAVILHGSPGVGKTSAAHALAADMGWETVELNASDQRTADVIERFAGRAAKNTTLAGAAAGEGTGADGPGRQLVILDEADNIHGNYDRGGAQAITRLVKESSQPIVLIANEFYEMSRGLRNACQEVEFRDVSARSIVPVLRDLCRREGIEYESDALQRIAEMNSGDLRGAVNDLQAVAEDADRLTEEDVVTGGRDRSVDIWTFLDAVLKEKMPQEALYTAYDVDETPDDLTRWVEDKVSMLYDGPELARAYDALANADRWLGRVRATQNYSYWRYATDNLAAGVAAARDGTSGGYTRYGGPPQFWPSSDETADYVVRKIAERSGTSMATARRELLPFLAAMTHHCQPRDLAVAMAAAYEFDEEHVAFVTGSGESTNKVESIVADAAEMREETMEEHSGGAFADAIRSEAAEDDGDGTAESEDAGAAAANGGADGTTDDAADGEASDDGSGTAGEDDGQTSFSDF
jgi:replication factor C large subunit